MNLVPFEIVALQIQTNLLRKCFSFSKPTWLLSFFFLFATLFVFRTFPLLGPEPQYKPLEVFGSPHYFTFNLVPQLADTFCTPERALVGCWAVCCLYLNPKG